MPEFGDGGIGSKMLAKIVRSILIKDGRRRQKNAA